MKGSQLHHYDLQLCAYVLGTIRGYLDQSSFAAFVAKEIDPPLLAQLQTLAAAPGQLLLTEQDLSELAEAFEDGYKFDRPWVPYQPLHRRSIDCVADIRRALADHYAEEWATQSAEFARRLENDRTRLSHGIKLVHDWIRLVRRYLRAMGATALLPCPEGSFPTPACPEPPAAPTPTGVVEVEAASSDALITAMAKSQTLQAEKLDRIADLLIQQKTVKEWYDIAEVAQRLGKAEFTVREWCRLRQCEAEKRKSYRGGKKQWMIPHHEVLRLDNEGPAPLKSFHS